MEVGSAREVCSTRGSDRHLNALDRLAVIAVPVKHNRRWRLPPITSDYQNDRVLNFSAAAGRLRPPRRPGTEQTFPFACRMGRGRRPGLRKRRNLACFGAFWRFWHPPAGARRATTVAEPGTGWRFHSRFQRASGRHPRLSPEGGRRRGRQGRATERVVFSPIPYRLGLRKWKLTENEVRETVTGF